MLTKTDLDQIQKAIREEIKTGTGPIKSDVGVLKSKESKNTLIFLLFHKTYN